MDKEGNRISYSFIDLVTPFKKRTLKRGKPRIFLIRTTLLRGDIEIFSGIASPFDEPNPIIGMAICMCKAKHIPIPDWIMHPVEKRDTCKETWRCN